MRKILTLYLILYTYNFYAQKDTSDYVFQDALENAVANNEDLAFDYDTEFEYLKDYIKHPLNINKATRLEFENLKLLSPQQISDIINHRERRNKYIALTELEGVIDMFTLQRILPFITVEDVSNLMQVPVREWFKRGKNSLFVRFGRQLEQADGYLRPNTEGGYYGNANKYYMRYRYAFAKNLTYGFTLERDAGEKNKLDFYSIHFKISDINQHIKAICIGDYSVSLGQGLIHENGFNMGKNAMVLSVEKNNAPLKAYTSVNEYNFQRGIATHIKTSWNTEGVLFASYRKRDGNLKPIIENDLTENVITSLQTSGFHRTNAEIQDKNAVDLLTVGGRFLRYIKRGSLALNTVYNQFSKTINPRDELYNLFVFRGKQLLNSSLDYKYTYQNFHFFGETAVSYNPNGINTANGLGAATLNGLLLGLDKKLSISVLHRNFSLKYQSIQAQPFAETSRIQDEKGVYMGLEFRPNRRFTFSGYADAWHHHWWRFRIDAPSFGAEYFAKLSYRYKNTEGYLQFRTKSKMENAKRPNSLKTNEIASVSKTQLRIHIQHKLSKQLTLRNRLELSFYNKADSSKSKGYMLYQDVLYDFEKYPLSISSRFAVFDTKDYQSAIYAYENDLLYNFTILPYYYRGSRFYMNMSYKGLKNCLLECRFARTYLSNRSIIGSGLDAVEGGVKTDVKLQASISF